MLRDEEIEAQGNSVSRAKSLEKGRARVGPQSPGLFHVTTKLPREGWRPRPVRTDTCRLTSQHNLQTGAGRGKRPTGSHCHLVAIWGHCTGSSSATHLTTAQEKKFIFLSPALSNAGEGTGQLHLQLHLWSALPLPGHLLGPALCRAPRGNRGVPV